MVHLLIWNAPLIFIFINWSFEAILGVNVENILKQSSGIMRVVSCMYVLFFIEVFEAFGIILDWKYINILDPE